jgi:hypothetical protein
MAEVPAPHAAQWNWLLLHEIIHSNKSGFIDW